MLMFSEKWQIHFDRKNSCKMKRIRIFIRKKGKCPEPFFLRFRFNPERMIK